MLVHKESLGVLYYMWNKAGTKLVPGTFHNYPEARADEWWEIDNQAPLARRILFCYPDFIPIVNSNGQLIDINNIRTSEKKESRKVKLDEQREKKKDIARRKGYVAQYNLGQRDNFLYFISDILGEAEKSKSGRRHKEQGWMSKRELEAVKRLQREENKRRGLETLMRNR